MNQKPIVIAWGALGSVALTVLAPLSGQASDAYSREARNRDNRRRIIGATEMPKVKLPTPEEVKKPSNEEILSDRLEALRARLARSSGDFANSR